MANRQVVFAKTRTTRKLYKRVEVTNAPGVQATGFTSRPDGAEEIYYETTLDLDALHQMARKAAGNKNWKATDGPLAVRVLATRKIQEAK